MTIKSFEMESNNVKTKEWKCDYHLMPQEGVLGETLDLCYFNNYYHAFCLYCTKSSGESEREVRHYRTKDLIHWEDRGNTQLTKIDEQVEEPEAISSVVHENALHMICTEEVEKGVYKIVHAKSSGGDTFERVKVLELEKPKEIAVLMDTKVWKRLNKFYMIVICETYKEEPQIALYSSDNLDEWKFETIVMDSLDKEYIWEKPDIFKLNKKDVLVLSAKERNTDTLTAKGYKTGYFMGSFDYETKSFSHGEFEVLDKGFDFYALRTLEDSKGKRLACPWLGFPRIKNNPYKHPIEEGKSMLGLPRELRCKANKIVQKSAEELREVREDHYGKDIYIDGDLELDSIKGEKYEMCIGFTSVKDLTMTLRECVKIKYNKESKEMCFALGEAGYGRDEKKVDIEKLDDIRVFSDNSTLEVFINGGDLTFTTRVYPSKKSDILKFEGKALGRLDSWQVRG